MYLYDTAAEGSIIFHFADIIGKEQHLRIADVRNQREILAVVIDTESSVGNIVLLDIAPSLEVGLPRSAERWV